MKERLEAWQRRLTARIGGDIGTAEARRLAGVQYTWVDHGFLRVLWRNFHQVAPGAYRSNQPSGRQLRAVHAKTGLKTVLNLRGASQQSFYLFEAEVCRELGVALIDLPLSASAAPTRAALEQLISLLQGLPRPVLIHCKSGADRTGLAAAVYLLVIEGQPIAVARRQLSWRFVHVAASKAGIHDHLLRIYAQASATSGIGFLDWIRTEYDPSAATASFARWRAGDRSLT